MRDETTDPPIAVWVRLSTGSNRLLTQLGPQDHGATIVGWADSDGNRFEGVPPGVTWPPRPSGRSRARAAGPGLFGEDR